jgi:hypothetical protein
MSRTADHHPGVSPEGRDGQRSGRRGVASRSAVAAFCVLCGGGAFALESLTDRGVTVEFEPRDRDVARDIPAAVRRSGEQLARELGLELPQEVRVRLLRQGAAFVGPPETPLGKPVELFAGVAYPRTGTIHLDARRLADAGGSHGFLRTARHECVHLAIGHTLGEGKLPKWFEEGLACRFGSPLPSDEIARLGRGRAFRLASLTRFPRTRDGLRLAYVQVESVMRFLVRERGAEAVRELLARVGRGEGFDEALEGATGFTVETLDEAWRESFRPHWSWRFARFLFSPMKVLLWAALITIAGYFIVKRRRRRQAEALDDYP